MTILVFVGVNLTVPLWAEELYPFTRAELFVDAPQQYCRYRILDPTGRGMGADQFSLASHYFGLNGYHRQRPQPHLGAIARSATERVFGHVATEAQVRQLVQRGLLLTPQVPFVVVTQQVVGDVDGSGVGVVQERTWRIPRAEEVR